MIQPLLFESYLAVVKSSAGSKMFRHFYALVNDKKTDIAKNGILSCALFVSFILKYFGLIRQGHVTVNGLIRELETSGWKKTKQPVPGCVLVWAADERSGKYYSAGHRHVGFYIGNDKAVSNNSFRGMPTKTHWTFGTRNGRAMRRVEAIYKYPKTKLTKRP